MIKFVYGVKTFITLNWKLYYKYMSPFSSMMLVRIRFVFSIYLNIYLKKHLIMPTFQSLFNRTSYSIYIWVQAW